MDGASITTETVLLLGFPLEADGSGSVSKSDGLLVVPGLAAPRGLSLLNGNLLAVKRLGGVSSFSFFSPLSFRFELTLSFVPR
jgi:hypothetical protein